MSLDSNVTIRNTQYAIRNKHALTLHTCTTTTHNTPPINSLQYYCRSEENEITQLRAALANEERKTAELAQRHVEELAAAERTYAALTQENASLRAQLQALSVTAPEVRKVLNTTLLKKFLHSSPTLSSSLFFIGTCHTSENAFSQVCPHN
jgi:hypothetical protein